jgi:glycosyltransferase involved in cell wall biosynthesis
MKIAYLLESTELSGGAKVALQQAEDLARRGHAVTVVSPDSRPDWFALRRAAFESSPFAASPALRDAAAAVATFWTTVEPAIAGCRGRVFHLCQGYEGDFSVYASLRERIEAAYRRPAKKLVVARHLADVLRARGFGEAAVIGQCFEAETFRVPGRRFDRRPLRVLVPGIGAGEIKGVREALEALAALRAAGIQFEAIRVSTEPPAAEEMRLRVTDEYHERVSPDRIPALLAGVDLFLGPSHPEEGFDLPALEALAAGLPCVLSDTPAHRNSAGDRAVFFPSGDQAAIALAVSRLLADPEARRALSETGPERARLFRTEDAVDRLEAALAEAESGA